MCPKISPGASLPVLQPRVGRAVSAAREPCRIAWEARPKPGPDFPANMSKQGLSARLYASNQTLIMVKVELLQGILAASKGCNPARVRRELYLAEIENRPSASANGWSEGL